MSNKRKAIGTRAETKIKEFFIAHGIDAERKVLHGSVDEGDLDVELPWIAEKITIEVKGGQQTKDYARGLKDKWLKETQREQENSDQEAWLVIRVYRKAIKDAEVWSADGHTFYFLDEFCDYLKTRIE